MNRPRPANLSLHGLSQQTYGQSHYNPHPTGGSRNMGFSNYEEYSNHGARGKQNETNYDQSPENDKGDDNSTRMILQIILAELLGTAMLIYIGCMGCSPLSFGFGLVLAAHSVGHISGGHFNPAVSIAAVIMGQITPIMLPVYIITQLVGGLVGYGLHYVNFEDTFNYCATTILLPVISEWQAMLIELLATAFLAVACCSSWDKKNSSNDGTGSVKMGLILTGLIYATTRYTGASFNSARTLPPAIFADFWKSHWVYWVGPNLGGAIGALIYRFGLMNRTWQDSS